MLRGAEILFSAIFAVLFLKRSLNSRHYIGIAFCLVGISMVGASSLLKPTEGGSSDAGKIALGMALIVIAQARQHTFQLQSPLLDQPGSDHAAHAEALKTTPAHVILLERWSKVMMVWAPQAVQAAQVVMEDYAMSNVGLAPLQVRLTPATRSVLACSQFWLSFHLMNTYILTGGHCAGCGVRGRSGRHCTGHPAHYSPVPSWK